MTYCQNCAGTLEPKYITAENRLRYVCSSCGEIQYQNPKMVVGTLPQLDNNRILLCKRNIEPARGLWTLPAGYLELGETVADGAKRETLEETGVAVVELKPYTLFDIVHIGQIYMIFLARLKSTNFHATAESSEVKPFHIKDIPWDKIAFPVIRAILKKYEKDCSSGSFPFSLDYITKTTRPNN